jgi:hypothetical protein
MEMIKSEKNSEIQRKESEMEIIKSEKNSEIQRKESEIQRKESEMEMIKSEKNSEVKLLETRLNYVQTNLLRREGLLTSRGIFEFLMFNILKEDNLGDKLNVRRVCKHIVNKGNRIITLFLF